jgi:hypothetical protein
MDIIHTVFKRFSGLAEFKQFQITFNIRYKEHIRDIRTNNGNTGYANHILNTGHAYGPITDTMEIITTGKKGKHLNTLETYYIYKTN